MTEARFCSFLLRVQNVRRAWREKNEGKRTYLSDLMVQQLEDFGFQWGKPKGDKNWKMHYESLKRFKINVGHCNVPPRPDMVKNHELIVSQWIQADPLHAKTLGRWVTAQRREFRQGHLDENKISLLNDLGFCWERKRTMKEGSDDA